MQASNLKEFDCLKPNTEFGAYLNSLETEHGIPISAFANIEQALVAASCEFLIAHNSSYPSFFCIDTSIKSNVRRHVLMVFSGNLNNSKVFDCSQDPYINDIGVIHEVLESVARDWEGDLPSLISNIYRTTLMFYEVNADSREDRACVWVSHGYKQGANNKPLDDFLKTETGLPIVFSSYYDALEYIDELDDIDISNAHYQWDINQVSMPIYKVVPAPTATEKVPRELRLKRASTTA